MSLVCISAELISSKHDSHILVLLQAMKADPPADARCKDKFLVQSALITSDKEFGSISTVVGRPPATRVIKRG